MRSELRRAIRSLIRAPAFTGGAVLTTALGVGVATASFSALNWLLLRPLPGIADQARLGVVQFQDTLLAGTPRFAPVTPAQFADMSARLSSVAGLASFSASSVTAGTADTGFPVQAEFVMPQYFSLLGTRPAVGRLLVSQDDPPGSPLRVAVIGDALWATLFHRDADVVGRNIKVNTETFTVVGVAPPGFGGVFGPSGAELWVPSGARIAAFRVYDEVIHYKEDIRYWQFVTRIAPGHSFAQAHAELDARGRHVLGKRVALVRGIGINTYFRGQTVDALRLIMAVALAVLLVACGNVAGLVLVRGLQQRDETAMHRVLGATVPQLLWRQLVQSLLLGLGGAVLGGAIALLALAAFRGAVLVRGAPPLDGVHMDHRVALFAVAVSVLAAVLAGLVAVPVAVRAAPNDVVRAGSRTTVGGHRLRGVLASIQLGVSLALVMSALLLAETLRHLGRVNLGFDPTGVGVVRVEPAEAGLHGLKLQAYYSRLLDRLRALPGIEAASLAKEAPFTGNGAFADLSYHRPDGSTARQWSALTVVSPDYFRTLGIPVLLGRPFLEQDFVAPSKERPPLMVVNASLARRLFGGANPIGQAVRLLPGAPPRRVVGVVADARWNTLTEPTAAWQGGPLGYTLYHASTSPGGAVLFKSRQRSLSDALAMVARAGSAVDRSVPLAEPHALADNLEDYLASRRWLLRTLGSLAALTLAIAAVGLYGVVAFGVASRRKELAIRLALGAHAPRLFLMVLREAALLAGLGIALGLPLTIVLGRVIASRLYGVGVLDVPLIATASALLFATALAAAWFPARRAASVDPMLDLRS